MRPIQEKFCESLKSWFKIQSNMTINDLAKLIKKSPSNTSNILRIERCGSEEWRRKVAKEIGIPYDTMIGLAEKTEASNQDITTLIPIDEAVKILNEALEETGIKINKKQKQAVLKILREELEKSEGKTKDDIKKYLQAFGK